jgi:hypothetical protein
VQQQYLPTARYWLSWWGSCRFFPFSFLGLRYMASYTVEEGLVGEEEAMHVERPGDLRIARCVGCWTRLGWVGLAWCRCEAKIQCRRGVTVHPVC